MWVVYTPFKKSLFVVNVKREDRIYGDENVPKVFAEQKPNSRLSVRFVVAGLSSILVAFLTLNIEVTIVTVTEWALRHHPQRQK